MHFSDDMNHSHAVTVTPVIEVRSNMVENRATTPTTTTATTSNSKPAASTTGMCLELSNRRHDEKNDGGGSVGWQSISIPKTKENVHPTIQLYTTNSTTSCGSTNDLDDGNVRQSPTTICDRNLIEPVTEVSKLSNEDVTKTIRRALSKIVLGESPLLSTTTEKDQNRLEKAIVDSITELFNNEERRYLPETTAAAAATDEPPLRSTSSIENHDNDSQQQKQLQSELLLIATQKEVEELRRTNEELLTQKQKMTANLRKRREKLIEVEEKLKLANESISTFQNEKGTLLQGIQNLTTIRDELKMKVRCKNDISREQKMYVDKLEKKMRIEQASRNKEQQLLQYYRQLSLHTGYFKWGKPIRSLEAELAIALGEEEENSESM